MSVCTFIRGPRKDSVRKIICQKRGQAAEFFGISSIAETAAKMAPNRITSHHAEAFPKKQAPNKPSRDDADCRNVNRPTQPKS
jgi:hypothetical protein